MSITDVVSLPEAFRARQASAATRRRRHLALPDPIDARKMMLFQIAPLRACNLRCTHCFISNDHKAIKKRMSLDLLDETLATLMEFARHIPSSCMEMEMFGGEIHLMPPQEMYDFACRGIDASLDYLAWHARTKPADQPFVSDFDLISNLINIRPASVDAMVAAQDYANRRKAEVLPTLPPNRIFKFCVTTSWEPDTNRFYRPETFTQFRQTVHDMRDRGVEVHVVFTGTKGVVGTGGEKLMQIADDIRVTDVFFDLFSEYGEGAVNAALHEITDYDQMVQFLIGLYDEYYDHARSQERWDWFGPLPGPGLTIEYYHNRLLAEAVVDYDGTVAPEEMTAPGEQHGGDGVFKIGSVDRQTAIDNLFAMNQRRLTGDFREMARNGCLSCEYARQCQGGNRHFKGRFNTPGRCDGLKPFLDHVFNKDRVQWPHLAEYARQVTARSA